jgi:hypothetical protein
VPRLRRQRRQQQAASHQGYAEFHHGSGTKPVHQPANQRAYARGDHKAKGEGAAVVPRSHPNSSMIGGKNSENAVRAFTPIAMVTNVTAMTTHP